MSDNCVDQKAAPLSIRWEKGELLLLDQTVLPHQQVYEKQETIEQVWQSIKMLKVRGAPAIGVAAAYGLCIGLKGHLDKTIEEFMALMEEKSRYLTSARPTAVNLGWAIRRMMACAKSMDACSAGEIYQSLLREAGDIHEEDKEISRGIAKTGAPLIKDGMGIMTHCNAGSLATSILGTATAPMYEAHENGVKFKIYANETRPLLQGARLTSWELMNAGIDVTLITDNMAAHMMATGHIDMVIVGTDRVASNGDVANKIGTLGVAIMANYFSIPFYVACPSSTIDMDTDCGADIPIEERDAEEVTHVFGAQTAHMETKVRNPAFDVTPSGLVTGIITEYGIIKAPYDKGLVNFFKGKVDV